MEKYDIIYSIGRDCGCCLYLKENNIRITSGPFDWLTNAGFETRMELMINDFNRFLEKSDLRFLPKNPRILNDENYDYYENVHNRFYYYHDFPTHIPLEDSFDTIKEKYNRRIQRFYEHIKNKDKVLLIWFSFYQETPNSVLLDLCDRFSKKMGKPIHFLIIEHDKTKKIGEAKKEIVSPYITKYQLFAIELDDDGNPTTLGRKTACNEIFKKYKLIIPVNTRVRNIVLKLSIKLITFPIPVKKWRRALRRKLQGE